MSENNSHPADENSSTIDVNDYEQVEKIHRLFPDHTHDEIVGIIQQYGPERINILRHLTEKGIR